MPDLTVDQEVVLAKEHFAPIRAREDDYPDLAVLDSPTSGRSLVVMEGIPTADLRRVALLTVVEDSQATRVVTISDSWIHYEDLEDHEPDFPNDPLRVKKLPGEYEDRVEALIVNVITAALRSSVICPYEVVDGQVVWGQESRLQESDVMGTPEVVQLAIKART